MAASCEAKKYGVKSSMPTRLALKRCPNATVIKGDEELYTQYSNIVNEIITEKAPVHERAGIDEFYMDMSGMDRFFGSFQFTEELVRSVRKETGLSVSFGLSVNKTVAKICTTCAGPSGSLFVPGKQVQPFLDPQSIKSIPQLGPVSYKLLRRIRIKIIQTLRMLPMDAMHELLGQSGVQLWKRANGIDQTPVKPYSDKKSLSKEYTFDKDTQNLEELKATLLTIVEHLAFQLRKSNQLCSTITLKIRYTNLDTESQQKRIAFTSNDDKLIGYANELFGRLYQRRMLLRMIGVKLSGLVSGNQQIDLFEDNVKMVRLYQAMDRLKHRFDNPNLVRRATGFKISH